MGRNLPTFIPSDFAKSDCINKPIFFSDRKIKIRSSESDRIINGLTTDGINFYFVPGPFVSSSPVLHLEVETIPAVYFEVHGIGSTYTAAVVDLYRIICD